jgi:hypothetical protein
VLEGRVIFFLSPTILGNTCCMPHLSCLFVCIAAMTDYLLPSPPVVYTSLMWRNPLSSKALQQETNEKLNQNRKTKNIQDHLFKGSQSVLTLILVNAPTSTSQFGHYPPGSSSSRPLSRNLRPISVDRRN